LPSLALGIGFVFIAVVVTVDLVAAAVAIAVLAAVTAFATLLVAPAPSAMRIAAYFAVGIQGFVVAALLIARQGGASLAFDMISPSAISPGAVLAATAGAALFAGLYPFVPWRYQPAQALAAAEREPLRGLLAMPAGVAAAGLTVLYAAAVSLALPEQWEVARHDVTLATLWIAFAVGTPIALASGLFILVSAAFAALLESVWMPPHRAYIAIMATSVWTVIGVIGLATGAAAAADPPTAVAAVFVIVVVLFLELAHAGRRLAQGEAPPDLDMAAAVAALFSTALVASLLSLPIP